MASNTVAMTQCRTWWRPALRRSRTQRRNWQSWVQFAKKHWLISGSQFMRICCLVLFFVFWWLSPSLDLTFQRAAAVLPRLRQWLGFIQLQANELLHALPVLHLGGAVGVILTWLAVRPLRLPHLLVHLGQSQSGGRGPETGSDTLASIEVRRPQEMSLWQTGLMEQQSQLLV